MTRVLIAEDEAELRDYLGLALSCEGYCVEFAHDGEEVVSCLERDGESISLLLLDLIMPRKDGFETLKQVRREWPTLPIITLSGCCSPSNVATVLKNGAVDFLSKPIPLPDLLHAMESALRRHLPSFLLPCASEQGTELGVSPTDTWSRTCEAFAGRLGASDVPVLLRGETGVGKEVLARRLHAQSQRAGGPFLKLNCAALPFELVESELFGYEKGAFTGAFKSTPGKFEMANKGTILLDEIGDMDFRLQAKLLQVLQDQEFMRLGAKETCHVDVRVMAATHRDLEKAIADGTFREDLYYRLNIVEIHVPPLRERKDEIMTLTESFLRKYSPTELVPITPQLTQALLEHSWPGNVRELENVVRKFLILRNVDVIARELRNKLRKATNVSGVKREQSTREASGPTRILRQTPEPDTHSGWGPEVSGQMFEADARTRNGTGLRAGARVSSSDQLEGQQSSQNMARVGEKDGLWRHSSTFVDLDNARKEAEREALLSALNATLWNRKKAAALLKIDYKELLYKMKKLGVGDDVQ